MKRFYLISLFITLCVIILIIALYFGLKESQTNQDVSVGQHGNYKQINIDSSINTPHPIDQTKITNPPKQNPIINTSLNDNIDVDVRDTSELRKLINPMPNLSSTISDTPIIVQPDISKLINTEEVSYLDDKTIEVHGAQPLPLPPLKTYELIHDIEPTDCDGMAWGKKCFTNPP